MRLLSLSSRVSALGLAVFAGCSSGSGSPGAIRGTGGDFLVLSTDPQPDSQVFLNDPIRITFSRDVDIASANLNAVSFAVFDLNGTALQEQPRGTFALRAALTGDGEQNQRVLEFRPAFPDNDDYSNGGFKPGRRYLMQLVQGDPRQGATLRSTLGQTLSEAYTLAFRSVDGQTPSQLFRDAGFGGPQFVKGAVTPSVNGVASLGKKGQQSVEVRIDFNQPLNPASANVPTRLDPNPANIDPRAVTPEQKGRIYLEYDDPEFGREAWIPAHVDLEVNTNEGSTVVLRPAGNLPNGASVRVIADAKLEDLSGESNRGNADYQRVIFEFRTEAAREPQFDAVVENFDSAENVNVEAPFLEPIAELGAGYARASFAFEGSETEFDYRPTVREVVLNTDFTQISPANGAPFNVSGGVFQFRNVTIPAGVTVRGIGTKPMIWLVTGDFIVEGELTVQGGNGARVDTLNSANFPTAGGVGGCGGGNGGRGSPRTNDASDIGEPGFGSNQLPNGGGRGGTNSCTRSGCGRGGGGAGGSFATAGDPDYFTEFNAAVGFRVMRGKGGAMCTGNNGPQADAGPLLFLDSRGDNNFWGVAVDLNRQLRIQGEFEVPKGGTGGGGGGDTGPRCSPAPAFISDQKGGGAGAGGGVIIVKALRRIIIRSQGRINADGGDGGGGEQAGTNGAAGGGGGGSGGMVALMSGSGIHIAAHGATYADGLPTSNQNRAFDFAVSADGGVCYRGPFQGNPISGKYPGKGGPSAAATWDFNPVGGFGGLGLVQLMAPPGDNLPIIQDGDGSNTRLDDNIFFYLDDAKLDQGLNSPNPHRQGGPAMTGSDKIRFIAWRGFSDEMGARKDDRGAPVTLTRRDHGEGDIRPSPILLPAPFGPLSRLRSRWIDTGATARLADASGTSTAARTMVERIDQGDPTNPFTSLKTGPTYLFSGTFAQANEPQGYVSYRQTAVGVEENITEVLPSSVAVTSLTASTWQGEPAYRLVLASPSTVLGQIPGRYTGYRARLRDTVGAVTGSYRILGHSDRELYLSPDAGALPAETVASMQVVAQMVGFRNSQGEGFGASVTENGRNVPLINVRVGFAFHTNPKNAALGGTDLNRVPDDPNKFLYALDLQRPDVMRQIRDLGKRNGATNGAVAVQYDLIFNSAFSEIGSGNVDSGRRLSPNGARPELHYLVLPFQF